MKKIRVAVVDDHEIVRQGLRAALKGEADMEVVADAGNGDGAVRIARQERPDVMLLDVRLQEIDGPTVCTRVLAVAPKTAVVMLTSYGDNGMIVRSLAAGAKGYVMKDVELTDLKQMIRSVSRGKEIASVIHRSPHTVKDRLEKIGAILDVRSRTEIVAAALRTGLI